MCIKTIRALELTLG
jgi:hypothetical protein